MRIRGEDAHLEPGSREALPPPLSLSSAAAAVALVTLLRSSLPVNEPRNRGLAHGWRVQPQEGAFCRSGTGCSGCSEWHPIPLAGLPGLSESEDVGISFLKPIMSVDGNGTDGLRQQNHP